jgi:hypothetical protein
MAEKRYAHMSEQGQVLNSLFSTSSLELVTPFEPLLH